MVLAGATAATVRAATGHQGMRYVNTVTHNAARSGPGGRSSVSGMTATVFGANGFVGRYLVNRLAKEGTQVIVPYRCDPVDVRHLRPMGDLGQIRHMFFDPNNQEDINAMTRHSDIVYNLAGQDRETMNWSFDDVHVGLAERIAQSATSSGALRLIHMSALGADVESPSAFMRSKAAGEEAVKAAYPGATIIRPATTFGSEDRYTNKFANSCVRIPRILPFIIPDGGNVNRIPVYVGDVAHALVETIKRRDTAGETYELMGPEQYKLRDFAYHVGETIMRERTIGYAPFAALKYSAPLMDPISYFIFKSTVYNVGLIERDFVDEEDSGLPGLAELGVTTTDYDSVALRWLRRFRPPYLHSMSMETGEYKVGDK